MDPLATETARFWGNFGELQRRRPGEDPDRGVPPADDLLRRGGRLADQLGRWLQWHWKGAEPPGEAKPDI